MSEEIVKGRDVTILFDGEKCVHSRNCVLDRPDVFVPAVTGEWIYPDRASVAEIAMLAKNCPSGAIRYQMNDGAQGEKAPLVNIIRIRENGPLAFSAKTEIDGNSVGYRATLCRCGQSSRKPFCDGSHTTAEFTATGEVAAQTFTASDRRDGVLLVTPLKNGPLHIKGNHELVTGTGKTTNKTQESHLCRCGHSANKPYCDGSHARVGFTS